MFKVRLERDLLLVIEQVQPVVHATQRGNALRGNRQLSGGFRRCRGPALHRQQADHHLQAIHQPVFEFLPQKDLALRLFLLFDQQRAFARQRRLQIGSQGIDLLLTPADPVGARGSPGIGFEAVGGSTLSVSIPPAGAVSRRESQYNLTLARPGLRYNRNSGWLKRVENLRLSKVRGAGRLVPSKSHRLHALRLASLARGGHNRKN